MTDEREVTVTNSGLGFWYVYIGRDDDPFRIMVDDGLPFLRFRLRRAIHKRLKKEEPGGIPASFKVRIPSNND